MLPSFARNLLPILDAQSPVRRPDGATRRPPRPAERRMCRLAQHPERIDRRLARLDAEWDMERTVALAAGAVGLAATAMAAAGNKRFLAVTAVASAFLVQHAVLGWCPPSLLLGEFGVRTAREIERERCALKAMRGDFAGAGRGFWKARARRALRAIRG